MYLCIVSLLILFLEELKLIPQTKKRLSNTLIKVFSNYSFENSQPAYKSHFCYTI